MVVNLVSGRYDRTYWDVSPAGSNRKLQYRD
jgi:hypothetical protein